ncbi:Redoxin domain protein [Catenulispora acidiphila DSM 44928]|uniref:Redoxin domain protein n=1 Tax=Catenulispora acidiphila (strain DSM 44928 / JCM 14897 / NBRC 102108 / NRRL B-24433 / ID139908) TaxID=479433 RepID=C7Q2F8_CATAD|nr:TlpA disulfide reductase family protein [Catenulispora acidiphila]ACU69800.1 Redoxin domain protein [Catenulispora acidiphila DSM 44928]
MNFTILDDHRDVAVDARIAGDGRVLIPIAEVPGALGWERKPQGWCRGDICIPARVAAGVERDGNFVDLAAFAELVDRPYAAVPGLGVAAVGASAAERASALAEGEAPDFELRDVAGVAHRLSDLRGRKVALVFWASWCGCRYDLPEWERQHVALSPEGFSVVSVAIDRRPADAEPWIKEAAATHPALIDADGTVADRYQVLNVPTVVWIDEEGRIARPNDTQFATDLFRSMSGLDSARAMAALERWVRNDDSGLTADDVATYAPQVTAAQQQARTEAALALWLHRAGHPTEAAAHFAEAERLAPEDVTIWRGSMPLLGADPMGDEYFTRREALADAGIPIYRPLPDWQGATKE